MTISKAMQKCFENKAKVYPIIKNKRFLIKVEFETRKPITYKKELKTKNEVNDAMIKTYIYIAKQL